MTISFVSGPDGTLLRSIRETLTLGDEVLACVAFATEAGVNLVQRELTRANRPTRPRLLVTSVLSTTPAALELATAARCTVRIHNPRASTYHPKVFLARSGAEAAAVIGSVNLTGGLAVNVEAGVAFRGSANDRLFEDAWRWAEALWSHQATRRWERTYAESAQEELHPDVRRWIERLLARDPTVVTLRGSRPNRVADVTPGALYVETERSAARGRPAQPVPAWMINLAWDTLKARGRLTNQELLGDLRVHRSSFVLSLLARLPGVEPLRGRRMGIQLVEPATDTRTRG